MLSTVLLAALFYTQARGEQQSCYFQTVIQAYCSW